MLGDRWAATADEPEDPAAGDRAADDPEAGAASGDGQPLGYSNLLVSHDESDARLRVAVGGYPGPEHRPLL